MPKAKRPRAKATATGLQTAFSRVGEKRFSGYVFDPENLDRRFTAEIAVDGYTVRVVRADSYVHELAHQSTGDGCYGFTISIDEKLLHSKAVVTASIANLGTALGSPLVVEQTSERVIDADGPGEVRWLGRLHFSGWLANDQEPTAVNVLVDGLLIDHIRPNGWSHLGDDHPHAVRAFDLHLPLRFADGDVHQLAVVTASGEDLAGSPLAFLTFRDRLSELVAADAFSAQEDLRARLLDQLMPASVPFSQYTDWHRRFPFAAGPARSFRCAIVMAEAGAMDDTLSSLHQQTHTNWVAAALPQSKVPTRFQPKLVRNFLKGEGAGCEYILFGLSGTVLAPEALQRIGHAFATFESAVAVYGDLDIRAADGSIWPLAFPAFDYERMLSQGYCALLFALRSNVAVRALALGATDLYRLFNSLFDDGALTGERIVHLPGSIGTLPAFDHPAALAVLASGDPHAPKNQGARSPGN